MLEKSSYRDSERGNPLGKKFNICRQEVGQVVSCVIILAHE